MLGNTEPKEGYLTIIYPALRTERHTAFVGLQWSIVVDQELEEGEERCWKEICGNDRIQESSVMTIHRLLMTLKTLTIAKTTKMLSQQGGWVKTPFSTFVIGTSWEIHDISWISWSILSSNSAPSSNIRVPNWSKIWTQTYKLSTRILAHHMDLTKPMFVHI